MIVRLGSDVSGDDRLLPLATALPPPGTAVTVGGYAQDNPNVITKGSRVPRRRIRSQTRSGPGA